MTTLVTGATGLVGNAIVRSLIARKRSVRVLARSVDKAKSVVPEGVEVVAGDVTDPASLRRAFAGAEVAYHAAGLPEQWLPDPRSFDRVNVAGTENVIEAARSLGLRRLVYTSTIDVFKAGTGQEYDESEIDPAPKGTHYERSKQEADRVVVRAEQRGLDVVFLHPAAVYGPGPAGSPGVNDFAHKLLAGEAPALLPGGMPVVFSDDVGEGHVRAEERAESGARFILSERYVTLRELARCVLDAAGSDARLPFVIPLWAARVASRLTEAWARRSGRAPLVPEGQLTFLQWQARPNAARARRELALEFTTLEDGLQRLLTATGSD
ncbi:MAG TPA: NAD-dependent epimerase/dehydratase family protein [Polyangiaceae bacterium]|nr:NAD-dependent epimerase/dehydratase family protein [Polyangiaceae bacterium]